MPPHASAGLAVVIVSVAPTSARKILIMVWVPVLRGVTVQDCRVCGCYVRNKRAARSPKMSACALPSGSTPVNP